ncbi:MAG: ribonuclease G [Methylococcales bacterium]
MSDEILINVTPPETRIAVVENGVVQEIYIERARKRGLVGNIYKGRVCRVLPGMQAAFVEIGLERAAFLHVSNLCDCELKRVDSENIERYLHEGQDIVVQVAKDPIGSKGARLTTELSIPSRYQVYMPFGECIGISQRVECEIERERLKQIMGGHQKELSASGGFIARTAAEGVEASVICADMDFLLKLWESIRERIKSTSTSSLIHNDLPLSIRALRDLYRQQVEKIRVDSAETYRCLIDFSNKFIPSVAELIEHYSGDRPIFDIYSVEDEIQKALARKVQLKSGGHLVFDQTEAMTTVDVNTGAFVGRSSLEETIFKTNMEAAQAIARQLRLRNLGGIIILDFIDMQNEIHKTQVLQALERSLEKDHAKASISEVSSLGLIEMTRKRTRESLEHVLCENCPDCGGRGTIKTAETTCLEIFREIVREVKQYEVQQLLVLASNEVVEMLLDDEAENLSELESFLGVRVRFRSEVEYTQEQYDVVLL